MSIELETPILRVQFPLNYVNIQIVDVNALQFGCLILQVSHNCIIVLDFACFLL
jgi:hypothetical protein